MRFIIVIFCNVHDALSLNNDKYNSDLRGERSTPFKRSYLDYTSSTTDSSTSFTENAKCSKSF